jgi:uncharacterized DUF497 family protein
VASDLGFDWDEANAGHIAAHRVSRDEAEQVFEHDERDLEYDVVNGEERWTVIGETDAARVLLVVFTMRDDLVRVVTAFEASGRMREAYLSTKGR